MPERRSVRDVCLPELGNYSVERLFVRLPAVLGFVGCVARHDLQAVFWAELKHAQIFRHSGVGRKSETLNARSCIRNRPDALTPGRHRA